MKDERRSRFFLTAGSIVVVVAVFSWEAVRAQAIYAGITPFPLGDYWELVINALLRDVVILALGGLLFFRRKRIPDRVRRYFPAVVLGAIYLGFAGFMIYKLALDPYFLTALALPAGLMNNIVPVLLAAFVYHHHPVTRNKVLYRSVSYTHLDVYKRQLEYVPFPEVLKGKYQSYTQADAAKLLAAGYDGGFTAIDQAVAEYCALLDKTGGYYLRQKD